MHFSVLTIKFTSLPSGRLIAWYGPLSVACTPIGQEFRLVGTAWRFLPYPRWHQLVHTPYVLHGGNVLNIAAYLSVSHPVLTHYRTKSSIVVPAPMQFCMSLPSNLLQWSFCNFSLQVNQVLWFTRDMNLVWARAAARCSSPLLLGCVVALFITDLHLFSFASFNLALTYLMYRHAGEND